MVNKKAASKRVTLRKKYKIIRKVKEHHRKERKDERLHGSKKLKKDPGIPNLFPFKEQMLQQMADKKARMAELRERQKEARQLDAAKRRKASADSLKQMASGAAKRSRDFTAKQEKQDLDRESASSKYFSHKDSSKKAYYREFKKLVAAADVILEVLDARDPLGCRCMDVEQAIMAKHPNKRIILVLNKIDLVPKEVVEQWLKYLRHQLPTVAFKCSTQQQRHNRAQSKGTALGGASSSASTEVSGCLGADTLLQLLKNYCRSLDIKTSISVGIIGYPNVGKSSLINSLKRERAVGVAASAGFTKQVQEVQLDKNIKLIDSPGIVFAGGEVSPDIVLRNAVRLDMIEDPISPVEALLARCSKAQLIELYEIGDFSSSQEFLTHIALKRGKLAKGGRADLPAAARSVLQDWNAARIAFYSTPPQETSNVASSVVASWGSDFDVDKVFATEHDNVIASLAPLNPAARHLSLGPTSARSADATLLEGMAAEDDDAADGADGDDDDEFDDEFDEDDDLADGDDDEMDDDDEDDDEDDDDEDDDALEEDAKLPAGSATASNSRSQPLGTQTARAQPKGAAPSAKQRLADPSDQFNPQLNKDRKKQQKAERKRAARGVSGSSSDKYDFALDFAPAGADGSDSDGGDAAADGDDLDLDDVVV